MKTHKHLEIKKICSDAIPSLMQKHGLGTPKRVVLDETGWVNPCFHVNDEWVLRFNARDPLLPKFQREKYIFDLLRAQPIPVPQRVLLDDSKSLCPYDVLLSERLSGQNLETDWAKLGTRQQTQLAKKAGELLGKIGALSFPFFGELTGTGPLPQTQSWAEFLEAKLNYHLAEATSLDLFNQSCIDLFLNTFRDLRSSLAEVTSARLVHGDYHFGNLLYVKDKITGVLDFEWAFAGDPLYDFCRWRSEDEEWPESREAFLEASGHENFTKPELTRLGLYQMIRNVELSVVARIHFDPAEAKAFRETTVVHATQL